MSLKTAPALLNVNLNLDLSFRLQSLPPYPPTPLSPLAASCLKHPISCVNWPNQLRFPYLVSLVHVVCFVYLAGLVQPNKQDKPNKPDEPGFIARRTHSRLVEERRNPSLMGQQSRNSDRQASGAVAGNKLT